MGKVIDISDRIRSDYYVLGMEDFCAQLTEFINGPQSEDDDFGGVILFVNSQRDSINGDFEGYYCYFIVKERGPVFLAEPDTPLTLFNTIDELLKGVRDGGVSMERLEARVKY